MSSSAVSSVARRKPTRKKGAKIETWNITAQAQPHFNLRTPDNQVYRFTQRIDVGTVLTTSTTLVTTTGQNFLLSGVPNVATYQNLFDQYRIDRVEVWLQPQANNNGGHQGTMYSVVDYDGTPPATLAAVSEYQNVVLGPVATIGHYHSFIPHVSIGANTGSIVASVNADETWISTSQATVIHYGIGVLCTVTVDVISIDMQVRYHLSFRNVN